MIYQRGRVTIVQAILNKSDCNGDGHIVSERAPDVTEGTKVEMASLAKGSDVLIKSECGVHDDTETSDFAL